MNEISVDELFRMPKDSYELIDIRDDGLVLYGMMPGAVHISLDELESGRCAGIESIPKEKRLILYCEIGRKTRDLENIACLEGRECSSLAGGYIDANIFKSIENVNLNTVIGYKKNGVRHSFLEEY